jgi:hypothetical protein
MLSIRTCIITMLELFDRDYKSSPQLQQICHGDGFSPANATMRNCVRAAQLHSGHVDPSRRSSMPVLLKRFNAADLPPRPTSRSTACSTSARSSRSTAQRHQRRDPRCDTSRLVHPSRGDGNSVVRYQDRWRTALCITKRASIHRRVILSMAFGHRSDTRGCRRRESPRWQGRALIRAW